MILAILLGPPAFAWWAHYRVEKARIRDQAVQVDRAILLSLLGQIIGQRDQAISNCSKMIDLCSRWEIFTKQRDTQDLACKLREFHRVSLN